MILTVQNTRRKKVKIYDMHGAVINGVQYFNTKTGEVRMLLLGKSKTDDGKEMTRVIRSKKNARQGAFVEQKDGSFEINSEAVVIKTKIKGAYATINGKRVK